MTSPIAVGGIGAAPASAAFEMLGTSSVMATSGPANGTSAAAAPDPALQPFAGVLARLVGLQATADANAPATPEKLLRDALASLEAAVNDGAPLDGVPTNDAGTAAIKALIAQVARPGAAGGAATLAPQAPSLDASAQALGAAAMIAPPAVATTAPSAAGAKDAAGASRADDDSQATRTDGDAGGNAATPQSAQLATNASVAVDPSAVVREASALDPAFRAKLERVIERMQDEFGHKVTVVETVRSQERQDALYERGRTTPGQVVTWTRNSRHADGLAADVMIDGGYDNALAFERLQRIANEEGLHTLGSRDAGHLELRVPKAGGFTTRMASVATQQPSLRPSTPAAGSAQAISQAAGSDAMARIARVAHVAEVAVTAGVARVATVARIATPGATPATTAPATPTAAAAKSALNGAAAASGAETQATTARAIDATAARPVARSTAPSAGMPAVAAQGSGGAKASTRDRDSEGGARTARQPGDAGTATVEPAVFQGAAPTRGATPLGAVSAAAGPNQASRVDQIDALHDQAAAQPVSSMVLDIDNGAGGTDRIRVDVRGSSVASTIDVRDPQGAAQLADRSGELARALESRGLESEGVRVRTLAPAANTEALRAATGGESAAPRGLAGALAADGASPSRRDRDDTRDPRAGSSPQEQDSHRQRSRREREDHQP